MLNNLLKSITFPHMTWNISNSIHMKYDQYYFYYYKRICLIL